MNKDAAESQSGYNLDLYTYDPSVFHNTHLQWNLAFLFMYFHAYFSIQMYVPI